MKPILVVDDEAIMRESLRDWLTDDGYQVEIAEDGEAALKAIGSAGIWCRHSRPDVAGEERH